MKKKNFVALVAVATLTAILFSGCGLLGGSSGGSSGGGSALGNVVGSLQKNPINGVDIFNGETSGDMIWGYYEAANYEYTGSNSDADAFREGMKYAQFPVGDGNMVELSALPLSIQSGSLAHFMGSFTYEGEYYEAYTEEGRAMFRKAYMAEVGDLTEEQYQKLEQLLQINMTEVTFTSRDGGSRYSRLAYKISGHKLGLFEVEVIDDFTINVAEKPVVEYDFLLDGGKLILAYQGVQREYLTNGYKPGEYQHFSCSGYALNAANKYKDLAGISVYGSNDGSATAYVYFDKDEQAIDPVFTLDTATGAFSITWNERWAKERGNTVKVAENGSITGKMVPLTGYGFTDMEGVFLFIDGQCYRYLMTEDEYQSKLYAGLSDEKMVDTRIGILEALEAALAQEGISAKIDYTAGTVDLEANFLFATNSAELSADGKDYLTKFVRAYTTAVMESDYSNYVSCVIIQGHTDTKGSYSYNEKLSEERAISVGAYCVEQNGDMLDLIEAEGCSYDYPVYNKDGSVNMDASRRVTFRFELLEY